MPIMMHMMPIMCTISGISKEIDLTSNTPDRYSISTMDYLINKRPVSLDNEKNVRELADRLTSVLVSKENLTVSWIHFESRFVPVNPRIQVKYNIPGQET
ncbi:hypothetical protein RR48_01600 [Papilio machaon]|uniref:Uncharacterized protein n=1 Tax=Papilio machaon TaxID=76193 RepID=A0A0N1IDB5_PAPMA|nr:hypothetical protein RR48_01600 [Papilio machaon]